MRNVWILTLAQALAACGTIVLVTFGGIVGTRIAPTPVLATLPLSLSIVGLASMSLPAAMLMQRVGRRPAFIGSAIIAAIAAVLAALSVATENFPLFCLAGFLIGSNMAFVQQYRFAAIEFVDTSLAGKAVATVMIGTLVAAVVGPTLGGLAGDISEMPQYTVSFLILSALCLLAALVLTRLPASIPRHQRGDAGRDRGIKEIISDPGYRLAVLGGLSSYAVMSFIMTATPLSMHVHDGFSTTETTAVITGHLLGMYLPSLATPWLVAKLGIRRMMSAGIVANVICIVIAAFAGHHFLHYFSALVLLGIGWNLMFVAATTLLSTTYSSGERFRAQGFNDFAVFGSQAVASLLAGVAIETLGWKWLNLVSLPLLVLTAWSLYRVDAVRSASS